MADPQEIAARLTAATLQPMSLPENETEARRLAAKIGNLYEELLKEVARIHKATKSD